MAPRNLAAAAVSDTRGARPKRSTDVRSPGHCSRGIQICAPSSGGGARLPALRELSAADYIADGVRPGPPLLAPSEALAGDRKGDPKRNGPGVFPGPSAQLVEKIGGADRDRTDDLLNAIQALSQLS